MTKKTMVFIPAYKCEKQITRVLAQFDERFSGLIDLVLVVDNQSPDATRDVACEFIKTMPEGVPAIVSRNNANYGLGGSHKVAFTYALENGFDYLVVLHGDDQANIHDLLPHLQSGEAYSHDCFLGSRFAPKAKLQGYSALRTFGNKVYNFLFSVVAGKWITDLGSGLNMYKVASIELETVKQFPDNLTFNYVMLLWSIWKKQNIKFFPITWREEDQSSNVRLFSQAVKVLSLLFSRFDSPRRFFETDHREVHHEEYRGQAVCSNSNSAVSEK